MNEGEPGIDLRTAKVDDIEGRDLGPAMMAKAKAPKKTWFVRRGDGMEFTCEEREAWDILYNQSTWKRRDFVFFGCSDGKTYLRVVAESMADAKRIEPEIAKLNAEIERYRRAEERLITDEAVDMDGDPADLVNEANKAKALRLRTIIEKQDRKLEALEQEYRNSTSQVVKRATAAEREVAVANWAQRKEWPAADANVATPDATPAERSRIVKQLGY